jgi:hypothetical protein
MKTCVKCGCEFAQKATDPRLVCDSCRAIQMRQYRAPAIALGRWVRRILVNMPTPKPRLVIHICERCEGVFINGAAKVRFCSSCSGPMYDSAKARLRYQQDEQLRERARAHSRAVPRMTAALVGKVIHCKGCTETFIYQLPGKAGAARTAFHSTRCAERWYRKKHRNKNRRRYEKGRVLRIAKRDAWVCGICGKGVVQALVYPHPYSPSIDHIVPVSMGGSNRRDNVRLAHLMCNVERGDGSHPTRRYMAYRRVLGVSA